MNYVKKMTPELEAKLLIEKFLRQGMSKEQAKHWAIKRCEFGISNCKSAQKIKYWQDTIDEINLN